MKQSIKSFLFFMFFLSLYWMSCTASKQTSITTAELSTEALLQMATMDRLIAMQTGTFLMYVDSTLEKLRLSGSDSLLLFSCPVGNTNKDGYWLYQKMYMSSLPEQPLSTDFLHFTKVSRDSFHVEQFKGGKAFALADKQRSLLREIDFETLESVECPIAFEKINQLTFEGKTPVCTIDFDGGKTQIYANYFLLTPKGFYLKSAYYKQRTDSIEHVSNGTCYLRRN